jgi:UDP-N-acetylmuramoyl-L-alanyl-D-glutamate--2,6-diaminopimelate ligase
MKLLKDILYKAGIVDVIGSTNIAIATICFDSRKVTRHSLFIAVRGEQVDGHNFISKKLSMRKLVIYL